LRTLRVTTESFSAALQAAAANKQGTLENYFDVSLGSGTYAPRRRQAYSSKRLQQVVADFRAMNDKTRLKSVGSGSADTGEDDSSEKEGPPKKKRKIKEKKTDSRKAPTRKRSKTQRGRGRKRSDPICPGPENEQEEGDTALGSATHLTPSPPALAAKLRPRPKPSYQGTTKEDGDENGEGESDSDDEFVVKARK
jgi:DNA excision repair protein ERCC-5